MTAPVDPLAAFHPTIAGWFADALGPPTSAQARAWPAIRRGENVLLAAPTGSGKTLAAFLHSLDELAREGDALADGTRVLYVSPLRALSNDIEKNLSGPLAELRARDATFPDIRVAVRTGDTPQKERARMARTPPHVLVTTPESLYILATSEGGRRLLSTVRTAIVDEVHAVIGSKRGAHLALTLERVEAIAGRPLQRVGLSATQKPLSDVADFLVGPGRPCTLVDEGHRRRMDLSVRLPGSPLTATLSHESWGEIHESIAGLVREHRSTIVFVNTRKVAERTARELARILGPERVTSHHSSLSKERRLDAEDRLKRGELDCLVATASLELGIDIGDIGLAVQVGTTRAISTLLQRVGRSGHGVGRVPKGVIFPASPDELTEAAALLLSVRRGELDRTPQPTAPLDVLAQHCVAACVPEVWQADDLFALVRRAWPYRDLPRDRFDAVLDMHSGARDSLLHFDHASGEVRATRRARIVAVTSGGAIPDKADYKVVAEPDGLVVGTVDEDFAIESSGGDVFQLGNMSWRILRAESGTLRVMDAEGAPPTLPFWFGEAPARTPELCAAMGEVRERGADSEAWLREECGLDDVAAEVLHEQLADAQRALGAIPTPMRIVLERFPDESGGTQLVLHSLLGGRINRAFGLALRKRFCRSFGFELQAAANEESILISLGPVHSFPLEEVYGYLRSDTVRATLRQAVLDAPVFNTRWRWNVSRALLAPRAPGGKRIAPPIQRMRADDLLAGAFPDVIACGENLPPGDIAIPEGHPVLDQTMEDCLTEAMDVDGLIAVLRALEDGAIERHAVETNEPSPLAKGALAIGPFGFLDDAGLEERRARAARSGDGTGALDEIGVLTPEAIAQARDEAWPDPRDASELHEALGWMGYVRSDEAGPWLPWLEELRATGRACFDDERWLASDTDRADAVALERGRLDANGPIARSHSDSVMLALEGEGVAVRLTLDGVEHWCHRRILQRIQRLSREGRRRRVRPISTAAFRRFLARWHGLLPETHFEGPAGVVRAVERLAGWEATAPLWEQYLLPARVRDYRPEWLDQVGLAGQVAWGRLFGSGTPAVRATPISLFPREQLSLWQSIAGPAPTEALTWRAETVLAELRRRGALFKGDLERTPGLIPTDAEQGLDELIARGLATSDSFAALRPLLRAPSKRPLRPLYEAGRWSLFRAEVDAPASDAEPDLEPLCRALLGRYGVLFRAVLERERVPVPWRRLHRTLRLMELRGDVHGGRFVDGYAGEQFALPGAVGLLREAGEADFATPPVDGADPLALDGALVPARAGAPIEAT